MKYLIGLDIGTSSVKGVLMTEDGKVIHSAKGWFEYIHLENGGVEYTPDSYLNACFATIKELAEAAKDGEVVAICASSASGNTLLLDKENKPLTNIVSWQDGRVTNETRELLADIDTDKFYRQIGWPYGFTVFPLSVLCYVKKHQPELLEQCGMVAMSTEYLYYALTGKWGITTSAGVTYYLIDQETGEYIGPMLERFGISKDMLPPILPCGTVLGTVQEEVAQVCGLKAGTPVVLGTFDHPSAARGVNVLKEGQMLLSCGTSWVMLLPIHDREIGLKASTLVDPFLSPKGPYAVMSSIASLSGRLKLYVKRYIDSSKNQFQVLSALAKESEPGARGLRINPQEEPNDDIILKYGKKEIARAIMEGTVYLLKERMDILEKNGISAKEAVMVGGPSEDPYWIELIQEICGINVCVKHGAFAGAVGAVMLAGMGIGLYKDEQDANDRFERG